YYTDFVKRCIFDFKFHGNRSTYKCLAKMMTKCCDERYPNIKFDYVTYVPMRKKKEHMRGFNQSKLIAKEISKETKIPFGNNLLLKIYDTDNQHDCKGLERTGNLLGAFDINSEYDVSGKTILLIDDIKTSGATLSECSKILLLYGAEHIFCLTAALRNSKIKGQEIIEKGGGENARREDSF
ncbi:MAG: ComF family protein, partial [Ruminococcus sp.]|nr:ComF family protein [Candidatus Copronaster equi]